MSTEAPLRGKEVHRTQAARFNPRSPRKANTLWSMEPFSCQTQTAIKQ